eukprot:CFRG5554T1
MKYSPVSGSHRKTSSWLVNPNMPISINASKVHGIRYSDVAYAPTFKEVWPAVLKTMSDHGDETEVHNSLDQINSQHTHTTSSSATAPLMVAHNAIFDRGFVEAELRRAGFKPSGWEWSCSMRGVTKKVWPSSSNRLSAIMDLYIGKPNYGAHRAASDVEALALILDVASEMLVENAHWHEGCRGMYASAAGVISPLQALTIALERYAKHMSPITWTTPRVSVADALKLV